MRVRGRNPVLRLIQLPVLPPRGLLIDVFCPLATRDATLSNGVIRFVELKSRNEDRVNRSKYSVCHGWMATIWKRETSSVYWQQCLEVDTSNIVDAGSSTNHKLDLNKVVTSSPTLNSQNEDVVYIKAEHNSGNSEASLLAINARDMRLEGVEPSFPPGFSIRLPTPSEIVSLH